MNEEQIKFHKWLEGILNGIETLNSQIPEPIRTKVKMEIVRIREFILEAREPRIALIGRRGAGKSSLINALFGDYVAQVGDVKAQTGKGKWHTYSKENRKLSILDTRGIGEGSSPQEEICYKTSEEEIQAAIKEKTPDVILFLCKAEEVDSRIDEDLNSLKFIKDFTNKNRSYNPPVIGIITQVDKLAPASDTEPPFSNPKKQVNINIAKDCLTDKMKKIFNDVIETIPVCSYLEFDDEGNIECDRRWNIGTLVDYLCEHLPEDSKLEMAKVANIKTIQKKFAKVIVKSMTAVTGGIGFQPIPVADLPIITGLQITMITAIGSLSGKEMNKKTVIEFMTAMGLNVGVAFALREVARALVKLIPFAGNAVSGAIAAAATYAMGNAAIAYFIEEKDKKEVKNIYEEKSKEKINNADDFI